MRKIDNISGLIIDMDGVLWHGNEPIQGLVAFFETLREIDLPFVLATLIALVIALLTVSTQSYMAANSDPVDALKYE